MRPQLKTAAISALVFLATLAPQVIFDLRHDGILRQGIIENFAASDKPAAFAWDAEALVERWKQYVNIYSNLLIRGDHSLLKLTVLLSSLMLLFPAFRKNSKVLLALILSPVLILSFYQGNHGNFYSYYMIGTFPIFLIFIAGAMSWYWRHPGLRLLPLLFLLFFFKYNGSLLKSTLQAGVDGQEHISLGNQLQAIDWIYHDAAGREFNVDVYVPPVVPYAYDYLIPWYGNKTYQTQPVKEQVDLLYTLYEVDPQHPERLAAWALRQAGIGEVEEYERFGGIVVQRRERL